jgi:glycosyltransferase involved in cell wall biosynthesis
LNFDEFLSQYQKTPLVQYANSVDSSECILTVRVIAYNHVQYLKECLDSILNQQTSFRFQIMLIDDDSSDGTKELCIEYAETHPDLIKLILNSRANNIKISGKPTGLFNSLFLNFTIKTKYLAIIEADDYWTDPNCLQKKVDILENNPSCSFCFSDGVRFEQETQKVFSSSMVKLKRSGVISKEQAMNLTIPTASLVFRNMIEDIFHDEVLLIPNSDILLRAKLAHYGNGYFIRELKPVYRRVHLKGMYSSLNTNEKYEMMIKTRKVIISFFQRKNWEVTFLHDNLCNIYYKQIRYNVKRLKPVLPLILALRQSSQKSSKSFLQNLFRPL